FLPGTRLGGYPRLDPLPQLPRRRDVLGQIAQRADLPLSVGRHVSEPPLQACRATTRVRGEAAPCMCLPLCRASPPPRHASNRKSHTTPEHPVHPREALQSPSRSLSLPTVSPGSIRSRQPRLAPRSLLRRPASVSPSAASPEPR